MHEMTIALNIVQLADDFARREQARIIEAIDLEIGELSGVVIDSLEFCFQAAVKNTMAEAADINIHPIAGQGRCTSCDSEFRMKHWPQACPTCQGWGVQVIAGREMKVRSITIN
ncbi:MAG: hydrogenase maturation nickel metallochaperone HypA [Fidelibacterota bacterium]